MEALPFRETLAVRSDLDPLLRLFELQDAVLKRATNGISQNHLTMLAENMGQV